MDTSIINNTFTNIKKKMRESHTIFYNQIIEGRDMLEVISMRLKFYSWEMHISIAYCDC